MYRKYAAEHPQQMSLTAGDVVVVRNERNLWIQADKIDPTTSEVTASGWFPAACVSPPVNPEIGRSKTVATPSAFKTENNVNHSTPTSDHRARSASTSFNPNSVRKGEIVTLVVKKSGDTLGIGIAGGKGSERGDLGIYVNHIVKGSSADLDGRFTKGDQIVEVNGSKFRF